MMKTTKELEKTGFDFSEMQKRLVMIYKKSFKKIFKKIQKIFE